MNEIAANENQDGSRAIKIHFDRERTIFGAPVEYRPGALSKTNDLYWIRFQVNF